MESSDYALIGASTITSYGLGTYLTAKSIKNHGGFVDTPVDVQNSIYASMDTGTKIAAIGGTATLALIAYKLLKK